MFLSSISSNIFLESSFKSAKQRHFHRLFHSLSDWVWFFFFGFRILLFLQGVLCPFSNFSSCLFVACAYSPIQYVHSVCMAKSYIFGMDGESTGNNNTALISLIFQPLLYFFGNKGPGRQVLQTSFYIFFRLSPGWP